MNSQNQSIPSMAHTQAEDLLELKNIPKVTKCLAQLSKLAASDKDNLINSVSYSNPY